MGSPCQPLFSLSLTFTLFLTHGSSASDYTKLVFKGCADQNFQDPTYKQTLQSLIATLTAQSSTAKFYNTTTASASPSSSPAITGLFQCRGDLSASDCNNCVTKTPGSAQKLCGQAIAARVQLNGCYLRYEISGFRQVGGTEFLYKVCGSTRASGTGFGSKVDAAMGEVVKGVGSGDGGGFYSGVYQSVYVLGQCEGDLSGGECVNCVKSAVEKAKSECGSSISAQVYLQECYIGYTYYPNGVPSDDSQQTISPSGSGTRNAQKTVALVLGGLVGVGLVMACLLFTKSAFKKKSHAFKNGG